MNKLIFAVSLMLLLTACQSEQPAAKQDMKPAEAEARNYVMDGETHIKNLRMITDGGENAEAYFSFGQQKLSFQAKTGDMGCDQIYVMNLDGSGKTQISNGKGATTCAFFMPGDSLVVYASTQGGGDGCPPPPDRSKGYVWQLYDSYDIYVSDLNGNVVRQLTDTPGYDAEAVLSPKGDRIVFTSTRDGDPELYLMDLDGSNQTRLTNMKGYDGGAFFSPDGERLVFRASRPKSDAELADYNDLVELGYVRPTALEIYVMDIASREITQVTEFGKASFAPYFHPDGQRIIFSSNINSERGRNFDLYIVGIDGQGLKQLTFNPTFDGFPMFTRDGKTLVFASNRFNKKDGDTNVFMADWVE